LRVYKVQKRLAKWMDGWMQVDVEIDGRVRVKLEGGIENGEK